MQRREFGFVERLRFSEGSRERTDLLTLQYMIPGCHRVEAADISADRSGIDYVATLRSGVTLNIDAKARDVGCSRYWRNRLNIQDGEPDLALERWSVRPTNVHPGVIGWTLDDRKLTDMVLFTFHPQDYDKCYLLSFQHLRMAMLRFGPRWERVYKRGIQRTDGRYESECVFVPIREVQKSLMLASIGHLIVADEEVA